jgi:tRNA/rRNA methyltransferase
MPDRVSDGRAAAVNTTIAPSGPVIVLVQPQLGQNIGMAARAMANCGLERLRLVRPRDGWPNRAALAAAAGAEWVVEAATLFDTTAAAVADLNRVFASTARPRGMVMPVVTPEAAARVMVEAEALGETSGILFGPEASGLANDDVALADTVLTVPLRARFTSLNLAMAVLLTGYEWQRARFPDGSEAQHARTLESATPAPATPAPATNVSAARADDLRPATKAELVGLFEHLEGALDDSGFLRVREKRPTMVRNLRAIFQRAALTTQEARTLRGVISSLVDFRGNRGRKPAPRPSDGGPSDPLGKEDGEP